MIDDYNESLPSLFGHMYKWYPRQWVNFIGDGATEINNKKSRTVELDLEIMCEEWRRTYETKIVSPKLVNMLLYIYSTWIKLEATNVRGIPAEMIHNEITLLISRFHKVPLNKNSERNPVKSVTNLYTRVLKNVFWKFFADHSNCKTNKYYQLKHENSFNMGRMSHEELCDAEGQERYVTNSWDFDWDFGNRLDDED